MTDKDKEALEEIRAVQAKMNDLQKAAASAKASLVKKEAALEKAQTRLDEARLELKEADNAVSAFASEQKKAAQKMVALMSKNPDTLHELLGSALNIAPASAS